ncbi:Ribosomal RNA small subunit methyltransferase E isoform 2 [Hibiscus syriacus]|uniref:16S rRNA (uracil(1498)-N(3))-methyltransferase n=1 Tax=Hibiscus syriacus TaxID=106335 RepID=A0A6A3AUP9_HIBSY|nr:Ribosomal RNA small subunit methyltransferase E isoform 2 [Hibiscus syriacus]
MQGGAILVQGELFSGRGGLVEGFIENIDRTPISFVALEDPKLVLPQTPQWNIFSAFSSLKGGRAGWLVEKCTELGATSVTPLLTERSSIISDNRVERLQRVILAAAKQCTLYRERVNLITKAGAIAVGLGPHRLRVETATIYSYFSDSYSMIGACKFYIISETLVSNYYVADTTGVQGYGISLC